MEETKSDQVATQETKGQTEEKSNEQFGMTNAEHETLKRALSQKAKLKAENESMASRIEKFEQQSLEVDGKKDEAIAYWKEKYTTLETKDREKTSKYAWKQVKTQLISELNRAGCIESDVAMSLVDTDELKGIEVDEDYNVSKPDLERIVETLKRDQRSQKIRLFGAPVGVNDMSPSSGLGYKEPKDDLSKLSTKELMDKLKE